jgi:pyruvate/2-oxoglutarate dehydrogenase complex dihydrolipoamide acyltransferase (E2) component
VGLGVGVAEGVAAGMAVGDALGEGEVIGRLGEGAGTDLAGPTTCSPGWTDGVASFPIPVTAPNMAAATHRLPPTATARLRQRSRRPRAMMPATPRADSSRPGS